MSPAEFWKHLSEQEASRKAQIEAVRIRATGNHLAAENDEPEPKAPRTILRARSLNQTEQGK